MPTIKEFTKRGKTCVIIPKDEYESMEATIEVLGDEELMQQLRESEKDI